MSESIKTVIRENTNMHDGDAYVLNTPYNGGTHLPDITLVKPVFDANETVLFFVAARGHHADIGGITPGSMPPMSKHIDEEGVLLDNIKLVSQGQFNELMISKLLASGAYPSRNIAQNIADLKAQLAACEKGASELRKMVAHYGLSVVQAYMLHVQDNAEACVRNVIGELKEGSFTYQMDDGCQIQVSITLDQINRTACIDFTGTSAQHKGNFNAPLSVARAAVLYVFRCLVQRKIPLNAGIFKALDIRVPEGSMLNPVYPAAVVSGNVETAQVIVDALFGALGVLAASQGTNNNLTFGNDQYQYYETLCGGCGAGPNFNGASGVHSHMTNSR
jgi:5-oxoprolinase (ATP-hydrolysing)